MTDQGGARGTRESGGAGGLMCHGGDKGARSQGGATGSTGRGRVWVLGDWEPPTSMELETNRPAANLLHRWKAADELRD